MTYTLYGAAGSGSVPVEAAMTLIGLDYRVIEAVTWEGEAERDKVAVVNPMRQIPAMITPEGETITESAAILIWLADSHPKTRLGPGLDDPRRAQFLRWMTFISAAVYSMFWVRDVPSRLVGDE
uniref:glutathione S-transferase family protein n=1 Tax=Brevundimonas sp. TaxID=1871086 RepID=UPI00391827A3